MHCHYCGQSVTHDNVKDFHLAWGSARGNMYELQIVHRPYVSESCFDAHTHMIEGLETNGHVGDVTMPLSKVQARRIANSYWPSSRAYYAELMRIAEKCAGMAS